MANRQGQAKPASNAGAHQPPRHRAGTAVRLASCGLLTALSAVLTACEPAGPSSSTLSERSRPPAAADSSTTAVEATSLLGEPLRRIEPPADTLGQLEVNLASARADYDANPDDETAIIWLGRRLAYLGRYRDAIDVYSRGLEIHPDSVRLRRHRGHRYITTRQLDRAVDDLSRAAELARNEPDRVEPDGAPNPYDIPRSTTKTNIYYHLALAHYLRGEFRAALDAWQRCADPSPNDDMLVAALYWVYLSARRLGDAQTADAALAQVRPKMDLLENHDYHALLLLFKGDAGESQVLGDASAGELADATISYGVAMHRLFQGDEGAARAMFRQILDDGFWPAFGYIAAEAELANGQVSAARTTP